MARLINQPIAKRGDVWIVDLNPAFRREIGKKRPALIISSDIVNRASPTVIIIPFSSQATAKGPERIFVPKSLINLAKDSYIITTQIKAIDRDRLQKKVGELPPPILTNVEEAIQLVLDLPVRS